MLKKHKPSIILLLSAAFLCKHTGAHASPYLLTMKAGCSSLGVDQQLLRVFEKKSYDSDGFEYSTVFFELKGTERGDELNQEFLVLTLLLQEYFKKFPSYQYLHFAPGGSVFYYESDEIILVLVKNKGFDGTYVPASQATWLVKVKLKEGHYHVGQLEKYNEVVATFKPELL